MQRRFVERRLDGLVDEPPPLFERGTLNLVELDSASVTGDCGYSFWGSHRITMRVCGAVLAARVGQVCAKGAPALRR